MAICASRLGDFVENSAGFLKYKHLLEKNTKNDSRSWEEDKQPRKSSPKSPLSRRESRVSLKESVVLLAVVRMMTVMAMTRK